MHTIEASTPRRSRRAVLAIVGAAMLATAIPAGALAKGVTVGSGTTATGTCNPVTSLTYKGDPRVAETGVASIAISYKVKPCQAGQTVRVEVQLYEAAKPAPVFFANANAPLSGKLTVTGMKVNTSYVAKVLVHDVATGNVVGTFSIPAAAKTKPA